MARVQYTIKPVVDGWLVSCNGVSGPPFPDKPSAVLDTLASARELEKRGHTVEVRLFELDGLGQVLSSADEWRYRQ